MIKSITNFLIISLYFSSLNLKYLKLTKMAIMRFAMKCFIYRVLWRFGQQQYGCLTKPEILLLCNDECVIKSLQPVLLRNAPSNLLHGKDLCLQNWYTMNGYLSTSGSLGNLKTGKILTSLASFPIICIQF